MTRARGLILACCLAVPFALSAQTTIRCESKGHRRDCGVDAPIHRVRLARQLSVTECQEGQNWGWTRDTVWVDHGCRADFEVFVRRDEGRGSSMICSSYGGRKFCAADARWGVELRKQLGERECVEGRTWGYDDRGVWVDHGCRAEFFVFRERRGERYGNEGGGSRPHHTTLCESDYNHTHTCAEDTRFGVELRRQTSRTDCVFNRTWGYNSRGIWVSNGCRAEFNVWER